MTDYTLPLYKTPSRVPSSCRSLLEPTERPTRREGRVRVAGSNSPWAKPREKRGQRPALPPAKMWASPYKCLAATLAFPTGH